jgi:hypothetical protein
MPEYEKGEAEVWPSRSCFGPNFVPNGDARNTGGSEERQADQPSDRQRFSCADEAMHCL